MFTNLYHWSLLAWLRAVQTVREYVTDWAYDTTGFVVSKLVDFLWTHNWAQVNAHAFYQFIMVNQVLFDCCGIVLGESEQGIYMSIGGKKVYGI